MKILLTVVLLFSATITFSQYHIIVECYGGPIVEDQYYHIKYTPDNWLHENEIHNSDKITNYASSAVDDFRQYTDVDFTPLLETNKEYLIHLAKKLKTIQLANKYNDSVSARYNRLHKYYMSIKPKFKPIYHTPIKKQCCKIIKIY